MADLPQNFHKSPSFAEKMFGGNPFPTDDPRHELWEQNCQVWAEKEANFLATFLAKSPVDPEKPLISILDLIAGRFDVGADSLLIFIVWSYEDVAVYEEVLRKSLLSG